MEEIDYHKLAISLSTNKVFMRKIKNSVNYRFEEVDLNRVTRIISKLNEHIDDRLRYHDQANEIRAIIIEELPKALKMLFAEEE